MSLISIEIIVAIYHLTGNHITTGKNVITAIKNVMRIIGKKIGIHQSNLHGLVAFQLQKRTKGWKKKNPERMAHLKARRYARERNALGQHSLEEWKELCDKHDNKCATCREAKKLTKDHIIPLSKDGSDHISNIQPLCRNCNSKKWNNIYENPELLEVEK